MTGQALGEATNSFTAEQATIVDVLPFDDVTLIGVAGPTSAMHGYLRFPDGEILRIELGEPMQLGTPIEIGPSGIVLELGNGNAVFLPPFPFGFGPPPA